MIEDLLGREEVELDIKAIADKLTDKTDTCYWCRRINRFRNMPASELNFPEKTYSTRAW